MWSVLSVMSALLVVRLDVVLASWLGVGCLRISSHMLSMNVNSTSHLTSVVAGVYCRIVDSHRFLYGHASCLKTLLMWWYMVSLLMPSPLVTA